MILHPVSFNVYNCFGLSMQTRKVKVIFSVTHQNALWVSSRLNNCVECNSSSFSVFFPALCWHTDVFLHKITPPVDEQDSVATKNMYHHHFLRPCAREQQQTRTDI